jgi:hypothetical protein
VASGLGALQGPGTDHRGTFGGVAGDRHDPRPLRQQPGKRDLRGRRILQSGFEGLLAFGLGRPPVK